jgi:hypothetical protein
VEVTLPGDTPLAGKPVRALRLPVDAALVVILRGGRVIVPQSDDALEPGDELLFVASSAVEEEIHAAVSYPGSCSREHLGYTRCGSCWNSSCRSTRPPAGSSNSRGSSHLPRCGPEVTD